ncbi:MAG: hypothetical protein ACI4VG_07720 [Lachnospiraceae bacterium]
MIRCSYCFYHDEALNCEIASKTFCDYCPERPEKVAAIYARMGN